MSTETSDFMAFLGDDMYVETEETVEVEADEFEPEELEEEFEAEEVSDDDEEEEEFDDSDEELEDLDEDEEEEEEAEETIEEFELTIDGEPVKVSKEELTSGYMRNKDYLAKVADAEQRVEVLKQEEATLMKSQEVFAFSSKKQLAEFEEAIKAEGGWLNIERSRDPVQVAQFKELYQNVQNQAKLAETVEAEYKAKQESSLQDDMVKVAKHLVKTIPNMTKEVFTELDSFTTEQGLDPTTIRDPKAWVLIHKAMMYDKAQVRKVEKTAPVPKRVKKAVTTRKEVPASTGTRKLHKTIDAMKKTTDRGTQRDLAVSAFASFI